MSVSEGAEASTRKWSQKVVEAASIRRRTAAAKDDPTGPTTGGSSVHTEARVTAPIGPSDQEKLMERYMLARRGGVWAFLYLATLIRPPYVFQSRCLLSVC